jgi:ipoprotein LpqH
VTDVGRRVIASVAALGAAGVSGCGGQPPALGSQTASVSINGADTGKSYPVTCSQDGWSWFITTPSDQKSGFSAALKTGAETAADSVQIRDIAGFTGMYWQGTVGDGQAGISGNTFTLTGTASGSFADNPSGEATATYKIKTDC